MTNDNWRNSKYAFYCNRECEFFPCHEIDDPDNFNCLFCYCPLYALGSKCGGAFRYTDSGIKVCTDCSFPHIRENYPMILARFSEIAAIAAND